LQTLAARWRTPPFDATRLSAAVPRLQERLKELRAAEEDARRWVAYEKAEAERNKLAEELARVYPALSKQLADLVARLAENDKQLEIINRHAQPSGAEWLRSAEEIARDLKQGFGLSGVEIPRITRDLRLPAFKHVKGDPPLMWPLREKPVIYPLMPASTTADAKAG
jgi:hypothetical protein